MQRGAELVGGEGADTHTAPTAEAGGLQQASWEREVAEQEARIHAQLATGAGAAVQQTGGQHAGPEERPALTLAQQLGRAPTAQQPAWAAQPDDDALASLFSKLAGAFQQGQAGSGGSMDMPGTGPARPGETPEPQAALLLCIQQSIERAIKEVQHKLDELSERLAHMTLDHPSCNEMLGLMQTCAITLNLLASSRPPPITLNTLSGADARAAGPSGAGG